MVTKQQTLKALVAAARMHEKSPADRMIHLQNRDFQLLVALAAKAPLDDEPEAPAKKTRGPSADVSALARETMKEDAESTDAAK